MAITKTWAAEVSALQVWAVPATIAGGSVAVELWGAYGGINAGPVINSAGLGGRVRGNLAVAVGDTLYIGVGGKGKAGQHGGFHPPSHLLPPPPPTGGGGLTTMAPGQGGDPGSISGYSGGGGGGPAYIFKNGTTIAVAVAVAGGGGGASVDYYGGNGGGTTGQQAPAAVGGQGGTPSAGGAHGTATAPGRNGVSGHHGGGGDGASGDPTSGSATFDGGGGGGGGWYGGGGGSVNGTINNCGGGGGGSNYVGGLTGTVTNTQGYGFAIGAAKVTLTYSLVPNAPVLTAPRSGGNVDRTLAVPLAWTYSCGDTTDHQSSADVRWRASGTSTWTTITSAVTGTATTYNLAALTALASGTQVEFQIRTHNSSGTGAWSPSSFFFIYNPAGAPTLVLPDGIVTATPRVQVSHTVTFYRLQVRVMADSSGVPGAQIGTTAETTYPTGTLSVTTNAPNTAFVAATDYHVQARVAAPDGVWTDWTDSGASTANINAPRAPSIATVLNIPGARVTVNITNPGSDPHPPVENRVYRRDSAELAETLIRTGVDINASVVDTTIGFNRPYSYRAEAVGGNGAVTSSP